MKLDSTTAAEIFRYAVKPPLFEPGEVRFWDDPHISKSMLEAHLNPDNDAASRKHATVDKEVEHLVTSGWLKPGDRVLDLGCGPCLYASRLAGKGLRVTGVDISRRSLDYAVQYAEENGLDINYQCTNFFDIEYDGEFDAVLQVDGELCTFSGEKRDELLNKIYKALESGGLFIFDISTREQRVKSGLKNRWYTSDGGFWRPGKHLVLEQGFDYPESDVWLDQYIVIGDTGKITVYRNWFHDYSLQSITEVLKKAGFEITQVWNELAGTPYRDGGDWIAVVGKKKEYRHD